MELTYSKEGDYLIPNIEANEEPEESLTKYGMLRETFLKEHHKGIYTGKLLSGTLTEHCLMVQKQAEERMDELMPELMKIAGATEELKAADQMKWVGLVNNCKQQAEEIIKEEIIYS